MQTAGLYRREETDGDCRESKRKENMTEEGQKIGHRRFIERKKKICWEREYQKKENSAGDTTKKRRQKDKENMNS